MKRLSRLVLVAALAGAATLGTSAPAQANHDCNTHACYECVMYPCYPNDWVEFLTFGTISFEDHLLCVDGVFCV